MNVWLHVLVMTVQTFGILDILLILQLCFGIESCKKKWHYCVIGVVFFFIYLILTVWFSFSSLFVFFLGYIYISFILLFFIRVSKWKYVLFILPAFFIQLEWSFVITSLDSLVLHGKYKFEFLDKYYGGPFFLLADIIIFFLLILINMFVKKKGIKLQFTTKETIIVFILSLYPLIKNDFDSLLELALWDLFIVVLNFALFYGVFHRQNEGYYRGLSENYRQQFNMEYSYFKNYKKEHKEIARFRHDWNNHLVLLTSMFEKGEYEKAKAYFKTLSEGYKALNEGIMTGNEIVDIIFSCKHEILRQLDIAVKCSNGLYPLQFMEPVDCCILFSNLIDNAIEANSKCEKDRYIKIETSQSQDIFMIVIENKMNGELKLENERLISTKDDKGIHGIGTQNAFEIIKKYQGDYRIKHKNEIFEIQILFPFITKK